MQFREGTPVYTADHQNIGSIDRVVIDPGTKEVTHVVVRQGVLFTEDRVVPVQRVESASVDEVRLHKDLGDPQELPLFQETYYFTPEEAPGRPHPPGDVQPIQAVPSLYWYPPVGMAGASYNPMYYDNFMPAYEVHTKQNIPENTVGLKEGADVISADGEQVGRIKRVFMDEDSKRATHLLISEGWLFPVKKVLPINWIRSIDENEIELTVTAPFLERLPEYQGERG